ncbi:WD40 and PAH domain containing protein [Trichuris trichiura]|uniref:GATOR2 complex protein WDR24 n=1 Tax=Trichuris trichiura TaxID=36087 RepID=A0A077Z5S5_TRITR|nr:WD40 and PAH domain containing protein [Trichuris trichiura]
MDQSSFRPAVKLPIARSVQNGAPLAMSHAVPTPSMPVLVGPHQPLRSAFPSLFPSLTSSIAPVRLIRPSSLYMPQIPAAQTLGVLRPFKTSGNSTTNRLGYFQQVPSGINSNPLIPRGPQLAPSAFMAGSGGQAASALPAPDAMGYLEQVKMQFAAKPQVYNEFLEIMKSFKDQRLDLLGVVKRIGALFFGFTHLINGFNTFMPHGYRLDVSNDKAERIVVHSATGKMHSFSENDLLEERQSSKIRNLEPSVVYKPSVKDQSAENTFMPPESSSAIAYVNKIKLMFALVDKTGSVKFWDIRMPDCAVKLFTAHSGPIFSLDFHPSWRGTMATAGRDKLIKVWNWQIDRPSVLHTVQTIAPVSLIRWRRGREYHIASGSLVLDFSIHVWDVRRPYVPFVSFEGHTGAVTGLFAAFVLAYNFTAAFRQGICWKQNPHKLITSGRDGLLFLRDIKDAS